jgi:hypothetical protein
LGECSISTTVKQLEITPSNSRTKRATLRLVGT